MDLKQNSLLGLPMGLSALQCHEAQLWEYEKRHKPDRHSGPCLLVELGCWSARWSGYAGIRGCGRSSKPGNDLPRRYYRFSYLYYEVFLWGWSRQLSRITMRSFTNFALLGLVWLNANGAWYSNINDSLNDPWVLAGCLRRCCCFKIWRQSQALHQAGETG